MVESVELKYALKGGIKNNLKDILKLYSKIELEEMYDNVIDDNNKFSKTKLIDKIYDKLTDKSVISKFVNNLINCEYEELLKIYNSNGVMKNNNIVYISYALLKSYGVVHTFNENNELYVVIPNEIMDILKGLDIRKLSKKIDCNTKLYDLADSMVNLYGVVPMHEYLANCGKYYGYNEIDNFDCVFIPDRPGKVALINTEYDYYIVKEEYLYDYDKSIIFKIISKMEDDLYDIETKDISLDELLKYRDLFYYKSNSATKEFIKYLIKKGLNEEEANSVVEGIINTYKFDYNEGIEFFIDNFDEVNLEVNEENIDEILVYVNKIIDNIPMYGNKGWSNKELILGKDKEN